MGKWGLGCRLKLFRKTSKKLSKNKNEKKGKKFKDVMGD
jgi:hypothetical protein